MHIFAALSDKKAPATPDSIDVALDADPVT
jgi:hypothetical protein